MKANTAGNYLISAASCISGIAITSLLFGALFAIILHDVAMFYAFPHVVFVVWPAGLIFYALPIVFGTFLLASSGANLVVNACFSGAILGTFLGIFSLYLMADMRYIFLGSICGLCSGYLSAKIYQYAFTKFIPLSE